ncbi:hypothetical protein [Pararhodonellum marinum]|uniref:hypothetical protein n=1 Tax=Pararhodonellum marinum TaxID=2755358 RepID=UPI00188F99AC|nr:hypothetical protein [Pararhodonellum marinum]
MKQFSLLFCLLTLSISTLLAQEGTNREEIIETYSKFVPILQETATGGFYAEPSKTIKGHPRFIEAPLTPGKITINGINYVDIPLSYDIFTDDLVTFHPSQNQRIILKPEKVSRFVLSDGTEFTFKPSHPGYFYYRNGIYELIWEEGVEVLAKHHKHTKVGKDDGQHSVVFFQVSDFFILKDGEFHPIKRKKQVIKLLGLDKKALKPVLKENGIRYRTMKREYLKTAAKMYAQGLTDKEQ